MSYTLFVRRSRWYLEDVQTLLLASWLNSLTTRKPVNSDAISMVSLGGLEGNWDKFLEYETRKTGSKEENISYISRPVLNRGALNLLWYTYGVQLGYL